MNYFKFTIRLSVNLFFSVKLCVIAIPQRYAESSQRYTEKKFQGLTHY